MWRQVAVGTVGHTPNRIPLVGGQDLNLAAQHLCHPARQSDRHTTHTKPHRRPFAGKTTAGTREAARCIHRTGRAGRLRASDFAAHARFSNTRRLVATELGQRIPDSVEQLDRQRSRRRSPVHIDAQSISVRRQLVCST